MYLISHVLAERITETLSEHPNNTTDPTGAFPIDSLAGQMRNIQEKNCQPMGTEKRALLVELRQFAML
jgi:hypothetical protein